MFKVARQVRKRGGYFALFSHISTLLFGNSRFINSCSTIDLKDANISFAEDLSGFIQYLIPNCNNIEIQKALKLSDQMIHPILHENEAYPHGWNSGLMLRKLIFILIILTKPSVVVETGTANGASTLAICQALKVNKLGHLWSVDILDSSAPLVPKELRNLVSFVKVDGSKESIIGQLVNISEFGSNSLFLHDGDHSYFGQMADYEIAQLLNFQILVSDDIDASLAFVDFVKGDAVALLDTSKIIGACNLSSRVGESSNSDPK